VILGLDAWCHIPQRALFLHRCAVLLRPLGRIAFYDHVVCQPMPAEEYEHFCRLWRFPGLETPQSYREALQAIGFRILAHDVTSVYAVRFYTRLLTLYTGRRTKFAAIRCPARYQEGLYRGAVRRARPHTPALSVASPGTPEHTRVRKGDGNHR
jgi:hypothetical protein